MTFRSDMWPDLINGSIELVGAYFTWRNWHELRQARELRGVYWPTVAFFTVWGLWNLIYYPALGQWFSFAAGILLAAGNLAWVILAIRLKIDQDFKEVFDDNAIAQGREPQRGEASPGATGCAPAIDRRMKCGNAND